MAIEPWVEAGWRDVTIQVDGELTALPPNNPLSAEWREILGARAPETRQCAGTDAGRAAIEQQQ